ncbi:MAG: ATP-binding protein [Erysipelotrichaceae bacterium]|nr:ATP-binding protein [Erysipelotrichaceae bacterium]
MSNQIQNINNHQVVTIEEISIDNKLEIIEEGIRKKYLSRLDEMDIVPVGELLPVEDDLIENIRVYRIDEIVYQKGEPITDKFTTVFNTLSTYDATVFVIIDSDGVDTIFYVGVRNNEINEDKKRSTVTLGDTLKNTLVGHFPGIKISGEDRKSLAELSERIVEQKNVASVSVVGTNKLDKEKSNEQFIQGLEKLALAMQGRQYTGIIIADNQSDQSVQMMRKGYQDLYTSISPYQKVQSTNSISETSSKMKSFFEMDGKQKAAMIGGAALTLGGIAGGLAIGAGVAGVGAMAGSMIGGQVAGQFNQFITALAPNEQISRNTSNTISTTTENKSVTDLLKLIDEEIQRTNEFDSYGLWNVAGYFMSDDMSTAEIAASNYRSLMNGDSSGREVAAINSWRAENPNILGDFKDLTTYISRFAHPVFCYGEMDGSAVYTNASTAVSGKELGLHLGLPRASVSGLPVIEHAEFGKDVITYNRDRKALGAKEKIKLGNVFDLGQKTNRVVYLENKSLGMHTFITGSTGSGKSNTVYQMLCELYQDEIPFLVVEPAKGEYKDVFGNWDDVNVFSTNPNVAQLININPFRFPEEIHVLEHIDGLVEIFSVCWPMYDAMPAFFKDAILRSYESVGWDLGSSTFDGDEIEYPDFEVLAEQLEDLIDASDYASDIKSNYRGALITRVKSLTVGLNKYMFTSEQTSYSKLFDENCILDISRVKSGETKALIMGLIVYILNEYRVSQKTQNNSGLKHVTVLEEAHNLLKNATNKDSELVGKSVEMLTQTIAEIRTYGEGFVIVDQSPSAVDISAIKNTNTKIVLRTPEINDREAIGRSMGLSDDQVNEIAKLPKGVAVVYQNDWVTPVLTKVDKAEVEESPYKSENLTLIATSKSARTKVIRVILQPWIESKDYEADEVMNALKVLDLSRTTRKILREKIQDYFVFYRQIVWPEAELEMLHYAIKDVIGIEDGIIEKCKNAKELRGQVSSKLNGFNTSEIDQICYFLTLKKETDK